MITNPFSEIIDRLDSIDSRLSSLTQELPSQTERPDKPMRMAEAAEYLGVSKQTLYGYVMQGKIQPKKVGKFSVFYRKGLDAFVQGEVPEKSDPTQFIKRNKKSRP